MLQATAEDPDLEAVRQSGGIDVSSLHSTSHTTQSGYRIRCIYAILGCTVIHLFGRSATNSTLP